MRKKAKKALAEVVSACIAAFPFSPDYDATDPRLFANLPATDGYDGDEIRVGIAAQIAADRAAGLSGNDLRGKYAGPAEAHKHGRGLTGPRRVAVLKKYGHGSVVAKSYVQFASGAPRKGTNAKSEGPAAADRAAAAMQALADEYGQTISLASARQALRDAGRTVPTVRKGDESKLRAAVAALRLDEMRESVA